MRLRFICFFVCETYLSACSAVLSDEHTVGGAKRQLLLNPEDDLYDLPSSNGRDYVDFWGSEECPTSLEQEDTGECCPNENATEGLCRPASEGAVLATNCRVVQPCGPAQPNTPRSPQWQRWRGIPDNAPLYDLVIYPSTPPDIY